jgi:WD40 repeat protein
MYPLRRISLINKTEKLFRRIIQLIESLINQFLQLPNRTLAMIFMVTLGFAGWCDYNGGIQYIFNFNTNTIEPITLRNLSNLEENSKLYAHIHDDFYAEVLTVAFSPEPDSQILASGDDNGRIQLWQLSEEEKEPRSLWVGKTRNDIWTIAFSPTQPNLLASGSSDKKIRFWKIEDNKLTLDDRDNESEVFSIAFSSDGKTLASSSTTGTLKLWDVTQACDVTQAGQPAKISIEAHKNRISSVAFSPTNHNLLATGSWDGTIKLWYILEKDEPELKLIKILRHTNESEVVAIAFSPRISKTSQPFRPKKELLASASWDGKIKLWDIHDLNREPTKEEAEKEEDQPIDTLEGYHEIHSIVFSPDASILATSSNDGTIKLWNPWNPRNGRERTLRSHPYSVYSLAFSPDGYHLASGSRDGTVKIFESKDKPDIGWTPPTILRFW